MRALAEFAMRGRFQACLVAFIGNLVPVVSPACVGLVTLRKGMAEGIIVALWAGLPIVASIWYTTLNPLLVGTSLVTLLIVLLASNVLRTTINWQWTLLAIIVGSSAAVLAAAALMHDEVASAQTALADWLRQINAEQKAVIPPISFGRWFLLGLGAWVVAVSAVAAILVGRWWQAQLYNPGGFREEFHKLRFDPTLAVPMFLGAMSSLFLPLDALPWAELSGLPLMLGGIAVVHYALANSGLASFWLGFMYFGLLFVRPVSTMLIGLGLADSLMDLRGRLDRRKPTN